MSHSRDAVNAKDCIYNLVLIFQAVGRGFDPRLPLHLFSSLRAFLETTDFHRYVVYSLKPETASCRQPSLTFSSYQRLELFDRFALLLAVRNRVYLHAHAEAMAALVRGDFGGVLVGLGDRALRAAVQSFGREEVRCDEAGYLRFMAQEPAIRSAIAKWLSDR